MWTSLTISFFSRIFVLKFTWSHKLLSVEEICLEIHTVITAQKDSMAMQMSLRWENEKQALQEVRKHCNLKKKNVFHLFYLWKKCRTPNFLDNFFFTSKTFLIQNRCGFARNANIVHGKPNWSNDRRTEEKQNFYIFIK